MELTAYLRVSTDRQAEEGLGLPVQRARIEAWASEAGHVVTSWHVDEGESGSNGLETRLGLAAALEELGPARGFVVYRLDRLARDVVLQEQLLREIWQAGAEVFSTAKGEAGVLERDDPSDPSRRLIRVVLGAVAEYERAMIRLRMSSGRRLKAERGGFAYGAPPYGWKAAAGELVPIDDEQKVIRRIARYRADGLSLRAIAQKLNDAGVPSRRGGRWSSETVRAVVGRLDR